MRDRSLYDIFFHIFTFCPSSLTCFSWVVSFLLHLLVSQYFLHVIPFTLQSSSSGWWHWYSRDDGQSSIWSHTPNKMSHLQPVSPKICSFFFLWTRQSFFSRGREDFIPQVGSMDSGLFDSIWGRQRWLKRLDQEGFSAETTG